MPVALQLESASESPKHLLEHALLILTPSVSHSVGQSPRICVPLSVCAMWTILKVFIECVTISLLFYVLVFWAMKHIGS